MKTVVKEYHPLSLVEDPEFKKFVKLLNPNYALPFRKTLSNNLIPQMYLKICDTIKAELAQLKVSPISAVNITTNGWTSIIN